MTSAWGAIGMRGHIRERGKGTWELRVFLGRDPITRRDRYKTRTFKGGVTVQVL
jgi:hypothetical protein